MKKCPFCAEEIQEEAVKCRHCGEFLAQPGAGAPSPAGFSRVVQRPASFPHAWFWPSLGIAFLVFVAAAAWEASRRTSDLRLLFIFVLIEFGLLAGFTYYIWSKIQDGSAPIKPGVALGLLFVPAFNIYWWFRVWAGFASALNSFRERQGLEGRASKGITVTFSISWLTISVLVGTFMAPIVSIFEGVMLVVFVAHAGRLVSDIAGFSSRHVPVARPTST